MQHTQEQVARFFEEHGCKLLSQYKNVKSKLRILAACGHEATVYSFEAARRSTYSFLCSACSPKVSYSDEDVAAYVTGQGCELLSIERVRHPNGRWYKTIRLVGTCGHEYTMAYEKFRIGEGRVCPSCARPRGEKHFAYNPELTDEDRLRNRDVSEAILWRKAVYQRDGYACQCCGDATGGNLIAHHLNGWADFPEQRFDVDNGVTLCSTCHTAFHRAYGFGGNTKEQYTAWATRDNTEVITGTKAPVTP